MINPKLSNASLLALLLVAGIDSIGLGLIFPILGSLFMAPDKSILPTYTNIGIRDFYYGLCIYAFAVCMFFSTPLVGKLSDSYGRKSLMLFLLLGTSISSLVCAIAIALKDIPLLIGGRILAGLTAGNQSVVQAAIANLSTNKNKTKHFGWMMLACGIGFPLGPIIGGYCSNSAIVSWFDYWTPFAIDALLTIICIILLAFFYYEKSTQLTKKTNIAKELYKFLQMFTDTMFNSDLRRLAYVLLYYEIAWSLYFQYIPLFLLEQYGFSSKQIANFMVFITITLSLTLLLLTRSLLLILTERQIASISLFTASLAMVLLTLFQTKLAQYSIAIPLVIAIGLFGNIILSLFSNSTTSNRHGEVMGIFTAVTSAAWVVSSMLTSILSYFDKWSPFIVSGSLLLIAGFLFIDFDAKLKSSFYILTKLAVSKIKVFIRLLL